MDRLTIKATITVMFQEEKQDISQGEPPEEPHNSVMVKHNPTQGEPPASKRKQIHIDEGTADAGNAEQTRDHLDKVTGTEREKDDMGAMQAEKDDFDTYSCRILEERPTTPNDS